MKIEFSTDDLTEDSYKLLMETATLSADDVLDLSDLDLEAEVDVDIASFKDQQIIDEYERRFGPDVDAVRRSFDLLVAGRTDDAADLLADEFNYPLPDHEKKIAALIARGRAKESAHAQS